MNNGRMEILKQTIQDATEKTLYSLHKGIENNKENILLTLKNEVLEILESLLSIQKDGVVKKIGNMSFIMSLVNLDNKVYRYPVCIYGEKIYIDTIAPEYSIDVSFVYQCLEKIKSDCFESLRKYVNYKISICEIERELYIHLKYFNMYIVNILREIYEAEDVLNKLELLDKADNFVVIQHQIYEKPYCIYATENAGKEGNSI